jgi:acyl carrier protein phosphodiesterase
MLGGFIADGMRKKQLRNLPAGIAEGVKLHWFIDNYTDNHPLIKESVRLFSPKQGKYATVVVDIVFDHFLAANWSDYSTEDLAIFVQDFYLLCKENAPLLGPRYQKVLYYMERDNWLYSYRNLDGLQQALGGISHRASFKNNMDTALQTVKSEYAILEKYFREFYPEIKNRCQKLEKHLL